MDERLRPRPEPVTALRDAIRRARLDDAERGGAIADLRAGEVVRLEILRDALAPIFSELPDDAELFDHGLVPGERPRLFIDILAFVEMGRDRREYRFVQDSRWGQRVLAETEDIQAVIRAVTDYVALRVVERSKALAADSSAPARKPAPAPVQNPPPQPAQRRLEEPPAAEPRSPPPAPLALQPPRGRAHYGLPPIVVFMLGVVAGIMATLFVGILRARGLLL